MFSGRPESAPRITKTDIRVRRGGRVISRINAMQKLRRAFSRMYNHEREFFR
jgi:hypothetical protein